MQNSEVACRNFESADPDDRAENLCSIKIPELGDPEHTGISSRKIEASRDRDGSVTQSVMSARECEPTDDFAAVGRCMPINCRVVLGGLPTKFE